MRLMNLHTGNSGSRRSRTRWLEVWICMVVVSFVGAGITARLHQIMQAHIRCAEHGELIHVDSVRSAAGALDGLAESENSRTGPMASARPYSPANNGHEHEHCHFVLPSRDHEGAVVHASYAHDARVHVLPRLPVPVTGWPRAPLYNLAPKTSPPA